MKKKLEVLIIALFTIFVLFFLIYLTNTIIKKSKQQEINNLKVKAHYINVEVFFKNGEKRLYTDVIKWSTPAYREEVTLYFEDKEIIILNADIVIEESIDYLRKW